MADAVNPFSSGRGSSLKIRLLVMSLINQLPDSVLAEQPGDTNKSSTLLETISDQILRSGVLRGDN